MTKRILSLLLTAFFVLPCAFVLWESIAVPVDPYADADKARYEAITEAKGEFLFGSKSDLEDAKKTCDGDKYIIKFLDSVSKEEISHVLLSYSHTLLAHSDHRLFSVTVSDIDDFLKKYGELVDYWEADRVLEVAALYNDPVAYDKNGLMELESALGITAGSKKTVVAVLDTGVFRQHEEFFGASILAGYDAVNGTAGVDTDSTGHGTAVIGIIAAAANNGLGAAGAANGVTVMPVKVASNRTAIYSSHLVAGIRFAADSGADVINMSVGGYSSSFAEQEAVSYALEMGCILIAAAGNEGNRFNAGEKCYPASYEGVISVGSVDDFGNHSDFSQFNDMVDVCAPGEKIHIPLWEDGKSLYTVDSGTSYSCAFVSAIAALAVSHIDQGVRLGCDEFEALIASVCGSTRDDRLGHGVINAKKILEKTNYPIITGVYDGLLYTDKVTVGFNRGVAVLDGETVSDGEVVITSGTHTLIVADGDRVSSLMFRLDYDPLSFDFQQYTGFARFVFERGTATLDGYPYFSGDRITAHGSHVFRLEYGTEVLTKEFFASTAVPSVFGVENGRVYDRPVHLRIVGNGSALLDGEDAGNDIVVTENGIHTLIVRSGWGGKTSTVEFEVRCNEILITDTDYEHGAGYVDEENGFLIRYGDTLVGARIYDLAEISEYSHVLMVGTVTGHGAVGGELLLFGDQSITVLDPLLVKDGDHCIKRTVTVPNAHSFAVCGDAVYCVLENGIYTVDTVTGETLLTMPLSAECIYLRAYEGRLAAFCQDHSGRVMVIDPAAGEILTEITVFGEIDGKPVLFEGGYVAVGNCIYDALTGELRKEFLSKTAVAVKDGFFVTDDAVMDLSTGEVCGVLPFEISYICDGSTRRYVIGQYGKMAVCPKEEKMLSFAAAPLTECMFSPLESYGSYRKNGFYDPARKPISLCTKNGLIYGIFEGETALYVFDSGLEIQNRVPLDFVPNGLTVTEDFVCVSFENAAMLWTMPFGIGEDGGYTSVFAPCKKAFATKNGIAALEGDRLFVCAADGTQATPLGINARDFEIFEDKIYALYDGEISIFDMEGDFVTSTSAEGERIIVSDRYVAAGSVVYERDTLSETFETKMHVIAIDGDCAVTEGGVFDLTDGSHGGSAGIDVAELCVITSDGYAVAFGGGEAAVSGFGNGVSPVRKPVIDGIEQGRVYVGSARVEFDIGIGFIDGKEIQSGAEVNQNGEHVFQLVLPFGKSVRVRFVVASYIDRIEILGGDRNLSVGESIRLLIRFGPDGASSVPVSFSADSDGVSVSPNGEVTAHRIGTYRITATAETEYGTFSDSCSVTVRDDLIRFDTDSGITVDRKNGFVTDVPAGMSAGRLIGLLAGGSDATLFDADGVTPCSYVASGCVLVKYDSRKEECDRLLLVVRGDVDGDGFITASDLYHTERVLKGYAYLPCFAFASDTNKNGAADNGDFYELERILLGRTYVSMGDPLKNEFGSAELQTLSVIKHGSIIDVTLCLRGCKNAVSAFGKLKFGKGLVFRESVSTGGWVSDVNESENEIGFYAYDQDGNSIGRGLGTLAVLRFEVTANGGDELVFEVMPLTVDFVDGAKTVEGCTLNTAVCNEETGDFCIRVSNADGFVFDPNVNRYDLSIPFGNTLADISTVAPEGWAVTFGCTAVPDDGSVAVIYVRAVDTEGSAKSYILRVKRLPAPDVDGNCRLSALEVEGYKLNPKFDPDVFEYSVTVPHNVTEIKPYCVPQSDSASVHISSTLLTGDTTVIRITVFSPDGDKLIYLLTVNRESEAAPDVSLIPDPSEKPVNKGVWVAVCVAALLAAGAAGYGYFVKTKGKKSPDTDFEKPENKTEK